MHAEYIPSRSDVGSSLSTLFINFFHMGASFCFFLAILMSSPHVPTEITLVFDERTFFPNLELVPIQALIQLLRVVFPITIRPTDNHINLFSMLEACGTSHVYKSWSAGTSTLEADTTASLIDLICPLTTFSELSAAPLDCGSASADYSCTAPSPGQYHRPENGGLIATPKHHSVATQKCPNL